MAITEEVFSDTAYNLLKRASIFLPEEVKGALNTLLCRESEAIAREQIETILNNVELASTKGVPLCQDTGIPLFYLKKGTGVTLDLDPREALIKAVDRATREVPLRQNCIHPLTLKNSGTNTGWGIPALHWDVLPGIHYLEMTAVLKGFGSEMRSSQIWVLTSEDIQQATIKAVLNLIEDTLGEPCPPVIIGIGIGGTADISMSNVKKALFRTPLGAVHPDSVVAQLEKEIQEAVTETKIGPMGLGGDSYSFSVQVEISGSHTAVIPISIGLQCWAHRYSTARIFPSGQVEYLTHPW